MGDVTNILGSADSHSPPPEEMLALVYGELRKLAASKMAREPSSNTLQPTALVHEAWLNLARHGNSRFENKGHFFAAAAEAMRRILVDRARRRQALRHGGGQQRLNVDEMEIASPAEDELLVVHEALDALAARNKMEAEVVKLRYFSGLTLEETAAVLGISHRTADNYWAHAKAWLYRFIQKSG